MTQSGIKIPVYNSGNKNRRTINREIQIEKTSLRNQKTNLSVLIINDDVRRLREHDHG